MAFELNTPGKGSKTAIDLVMLLRISTKRRFVQVPSGTIGQGHGPKISLPCSVTKQPPEAKVVML